MSADRRAALSTGAATILTGLLAGLYYGFTCAVMPGLAGVDDRTFVTVMNKINDAILNTVFMLSFLGAPLLSLLAPLVLRRGSRRGALRWVVVALVANAVGFALTVAVNVPLNDALAGGGSRAAFEHSWVIWNAVRAAVSTVAFGALVGALRHIRQASLSTTAAS